MKYLGLNGEVYYNIIGGEVMDKVKCKICGEMYEEVSVGKICLDCQKKICEALGLKVSKDWDKVTPKEKEVLSNLVYLISEMQGYIDYLMHAIDHHTHAKEQVERVYIK